MNNFDIGIINEMNKEAFTPMDLALGGLAGAGAGALIGGEDHRLSGAGLGLLGGILTGPFSAAGRDILLDGIKAIPKTDPLGIMGIAATGITGGLLGSGAGALTGAISDDMTVTEGARRGLGLGAVAGGLLGTGGLLGAKLNG